MDPLLDPLLPPGTLAPVVAQDHRTGEVRMVAFADAEALERTLATGLAHFHSRSRGRLWKKGESSGHVLSVHEVWVDCDADTLLYLVTPDGPTCHTGRPSCFFRRLERPAARRVEPVGASVGHDLEDGRALPVLARLGAVIEARRHASAGSSYTKSLLEAGAAKIGGKVIEEAGELAAAVARETDERVIAEAADLVYHLMVGLASRGLSLAEVAEELGRRFGVSGLEEKASRGG
ncbi:MAG: bifunctional phosphoribosyl-AMP cyclohydrolase/phosphoribosyl-ATP diphosphatase HisIE [Sandaracinaceae bacterium]